jgi:hypothetical protein
MNRWQHLRIETFVNEGSVQNGIHSLLHRFEALCEP